ncbi:MAG: hypothetical protein GTO03_18695 [Planctomycetales bacterium]|nr:hypothetical protein [Planctomycetales bacterium]
MTKGQRQTPRKPATKFMQLRKKMQQRKGAQNVKTGKVAGKTTGRKK